MYNTLFKVFLSLVSVSYIFLLVYYYSNYNNLIIGNTVFAVILFNIINLDLLIPEKILVKHKQCVFLVKFFTILGIIVETSIAFIIISSNYEDKWSIYGFIIYSGWIYFLGIILFIYYKETHNINKVNETTLEYTELRA